MVLHLSCAHMSLALHKEFKPMVLHTFITEIIRNAELSVQNSEMLTSWLGVHPWNAMILQRLILTAPEETSSVSSSHSQRRSVAQPMARPVPAANTAADIMPAHPKRMPRANKGKGRGMAEAKTEAKAKAGRQGQMHEQDLHAVDRTEKDLRQAKMDLQKRGPSRQENEQFLHAVDRTEEELRQAKKDLQKRGPSRQEIGPAPPKCRPPGDIPRFLVGWM